MTSTTILASNVLGRWPAFPATWLQRLTAWLRDSVSSATQDRTNESAATLYRRAAHYERTQPSFAADLRAAAEAMDRLQTPRAR